jgi:hypothetical protein
MLHKVRKIISCQEEPILYSRNSLHRLFWLHIRAFTNPAGCDAHFQVIFCQCVMLEARFLDLDAAGRWPCMEVEVAY